MTNNGKWSIAGVPHRGWECTGVHDLEEPSAICEMCEKQEIRYVHTMTHSDYPDSLECGCVCSAEMEVEYEGSEPDRKRAKEREQPLRDRAHRRQTRARASRIDLDVLDGLDRSDLYKMRNKVEDRLSKAKQDGDTNPIHDQLLQAVHERIEAAELEEREAAEQEEREAVELEARASLVDLETLKHRNLAETKRLERDVIKRMSRIKDSEDTNPIHGQLLRSIQERLVDLSSLPFWSPTNKGNYKIPHRNVMWLAKEAPGGGFYISSCNTSTDQWISQGKSPSLGDAYGELLKYLIRKGRLSRK